MSSIFIIDLLSIYLLQCVAGIAYGVALYYFPKTTIAVYVALAAYVLVAHSDQCILDKDSMLSAILHIISCCAELTFFYMQIPFIMFFQWCRVQWQLVWLTRTNTHNTIFPW